jgi:lysozyme
MIEDMSQEIVDGRHIRSKRGTKLMEISPAGIEVLREREGCELTAYQDTVGVWTIAVGHTAAAGPPIPVEGMTITQEEADAIFDRDLDEYEAAVNLAITAPMTQNEYDAFVSICFNIGQTGFTNATFVHRFNDGDKHGCAEGILWWDQPASIIPRRQGEHIQFMGGYVPRINQI